MNSFCSICTTMLDDVPDPVYKIDRDGLELLAESLKRKKHGR